MKIIRQAVAGFCLLLTTGALMGAPPALKDLLPPAVQRGVASEIRVVGKNLVAETLLLAPFAAEIKGGGGGESGSFTIKPAADTPPGQYPVRLRTPEGISNLRLLLVTDVPVVRVNQPDARYKTGKLELSKAQAIQLPCVLAGGRLEREMNFFRFNVKASDRLTFVTETWRLGLTPDPLLRLRDPRGRTLAYAHDTPTLQRDERIDHMFAQDGEHYLEVTSTGGGGWNNYYLVKIGAMDYARAVFPLGGRRGEQVRFTVMNRDGQSSTVAAHVPSDPYIDHWRLPLKDHPGSLPWTLAAGDLPEVTEDAGRSAPQTITWPVTVNGRIDKPDEEDLYRLAVQPGQHVRVSVNAFHLGSRLDGYLMVYDPKGQKLIAKNDDQGYRGLPDPGLTFEAPAGVHEVVVSLRDGLNQGGPEFGYRLTVEQGGPDFFLWLGRKQGPTNEEDVGWHRTDVSDTLNLTPGQESKLLISVRRNAKEDDAHYNGPIQGYTGPITLKVESLPDGITVKPLVIPQGKTEGELIFTTTAAASTQPFEIVVVGEATRPNGSVIRRIAERRLFISDPAITNMPWNWRVTKVVGVVAQKVKEPAIAKPAK